MNWRLTIAFAVSPLVPAAIVIARDPLSAAYIMLPIIGSYVHALIGFVTAVGAIVGFANGQNVTKLVLLDQGRMILDAAGLGVAAGVCWRLIAGDPRRYNKCVESFGG